MYFRGVRYALPIIVVLVVIFFAGCHNNSNEVAIGVALPLSGSMAEYGQNARDGLTLANEELSRQTGGHQFKLIYQDTKEAPQETVDAVRRLVDVNQVKFIIGGLTSSGVLSAAPYTQTHGVLFFTPAASAPGIPQIGDLVFRNWPSDDALASQFGKKAYEQLGIRAVAILYMSNEYGKVNAESFATSFRNAGGKIPLMHAFPQGTTDFKTLLTQAGAIRGLNKIFIIAYPDEYRSFYQQFSISRLGQGSILASDTFFSPQLVSQLGSSAEGTICAVASKPGPDYEPRRKFLQNFRTRFKTPDGNPKEAGLVSDTAYDALQLLALAINNSDGTPKSVSTWLLHNVKNYPGAAGLTTFSGIGDVNGELALNQVQHGRFVALR